MLDAAVRFVCTRSERELLLAGVALRLIMIVYSVIHDNTFAVHYTDIDYDVVTDGAKAMWRDFPSSGASPFERVTYRYTPLLAVAMLPNVFAFYAWGKLLLSACDVCAAWYAFDCFSRLGTGLLTNGNTPTWRNPKFLVSAFLLFNPIVVNVSTRGNSDMIITFLVLASLSNFARNSFAAAGASLGLAVHMKIYPIVFVPCFVFAQLHRVAGARAKQVHCNPHTPTSKQYAAAAVSSNFIAPVVSAAVAVVVAAGIPTALCYAWYGQQYLDEALLYHIGRVDHRHNFSPYWYPMYLGMAVREIGGMLGPAAPDRTDAWLKTGLLAFIPQMGALLAAAWVLRRNITHAVTVVTMIFVCFNKVCTVQYFVWYLPLLPFVFASGASAKGSASFAPVLRGLLLGGVWFAALVWWMLMSVKLEFDGEPAFVAVWLASLVFFVMQVLITRAVAKAAVGGQAVDYGL